MVLHERLTNILHALILNQNIIDEKDNYSEKLVIEILSQITNEFF
jgi:hypothetical protein